MNARIRLLTLAVLAGLALPARAGMTTTVTETFDGTVDQATWRLGTLDEIVPTGGSPGGYLRNRSFDSAVPTPIYVGPVPSPFLGNYRQQAVQSVGIDVNVFAASIGVDNKRPLSVVLGSDMGTPDDPSDDCEVYTVGSKNLPRPGAPWRAYEFRVPADSTTLPSGWVVRGVCAGLGPDAAWTAVVTNVTRITFPFADPDTLWYFQIWDVGIDSVHITSSMPR